MALAMQEPADSGSVDVAGSTITDGSSLILLDPQLTHTSKWWWYYATITGTDGRTLTLDIANRDAIWNGGNVTVASRNGFWSYGLDQPWQSWDTMTFEASPNRIRFTKTSAFTADTIHVAYYPVYSHAMMIAKIEAWALDDNVHETTSTTSLILGTTAERSNGYGKTCPAADLYGFRIEDESAMGSKNVALLTNGVHPGEHCASWAFVEAIDFLLSADPHAEFLRQHWIFYVYPDVNPQGRYGGLFRSAPDALESDYNRIWGGTTSGTQVDFRDAIIADTGGEINLLLDFHGFNHVYNDRLHCGLVYGLTSLDHPAWRTAVHNFNPTWSLSDFTGISGSTGAWALANLDTDSSISVAVTLEAGSSVNYTQQEYRDMGRRSMYAISQATSQGLFPVQAARTKTPAPRNCYSGYSAA